MKNKISNKKLPELIEKSNDPNLSKDERLKISEEIITISQKIDDKNSEAKAYHTIGKIYSSKSDFKKAITNFEKSKSIYSVIKNENKIAQLFYNIGLYFLQQHNFDKAMQNLDAAIEIYKRLNLKKKIAEANQYIGMIYFWKSDYKSALKIYNNCLRYLDKTDFPYSGLLVQIGSLYIQIGEYAKALENLFTAVDLNIKYHKSKGLENVYLNIGIVHKELGNLEDAQKYNLKALSIFERNEEKDGIKKILNNIGTIFSKMQKNDEALRYYKKALKLADDMNDKSNKANILNNLAIIYSRLNDHHKAIRNFEEVLEIKKEFGEKNLYVTSLINISNEYVLLEDYDKAMKYYEESLQIAEELNLKKEIYQIFKCISEIQEKKKQFEQSLKNFKKYSKIKEEVFNRNSVDKIAELQTKFETEQKEKEAEMFRLKNIELKKKNEKIQEQKQELQHTIEKLRKSEIKYNVVSTVLEKNIGFDLIGKSSAIKKIIKLISVVGNSANTNVLITGESGTGKEIVARKIHQCSKRKDNNFYGVNSSAVPETLFESEFFGHEKNAFTGANKTHIGWFEIADGGSLFLDEIGTMSIDQQVKLLRVLEERMIVRVGSHTEIPVDIRLICATNINLFELVETKKFREDLYHRLSTFVIQLPPLRERKEDIPLLTEYFVKMFSTLLNKKIKRIDEFAHSALLHYDYPGNVRELKNIVERAVIVSDSSTLKSKHFSIPKISEKNEISEDIPPLYQMEKELIIKVLKMTRFNKSKAADLLKVERRVITRKMKRYGIEGKKIRS